MLVSDKLSAPIISEHPVHHIYSVPLITEEICERIPTSYRALGDNLCSTHNFTSRENWTFLSANVCEIYTKVYCCCTHRIKYSQLNDNITHTQPKHCQHCPGPSHATYSWICTEAASIDHRTIMLIWQTLDFRLLRILMFAMAAADCIVYARISVLSWIKCVYVLYRCVDVCRWEWMNLSPNENGFQLAAFNGYYIILNGWRWWWWWWWWWKVETEVFVRTCSSFVRSTKRS